MLDTRRADDAAVHRIGKHEAVAVIHGGVPRDVRKANIAAFNDDPEVRVLIANDAAGEGVNLQRGAHLMVNYDLPWSPNRHASLTELPLAAGVVLQVQLRRR